MKKEIYDGTILIEDLFNGNRIDCDETGLILFAPRDDCLNIIDLRSGERIDQIKPKEFFDSEPQELIENFVYDNSRLIIAYTSGIIKYWSIKFEPDVGLRIAISRNLLRSWKSMHVGKIASIRFSRCGELLATGGSDGALKVWDIIHNYCTHNLRECHGVINVLAFSPHQNESNYCLVASGDASCHIYVWNLFDPKSYTILEGHQNKITEIKFIPSGKYFVSTSRDKLMIVWDRLTLMKIRTMAVFESIESFVIVARSKLNFLHQNSCSDYVLITGGESGFLKFWNYHTGQLLHEQSESPISMKDSKEIRCSQLNQLLYVENKNQLISVSFDKDIVLYDATNLFSTKHFSWALDEVIDLQLIGDNQQYIAVATNSPKIKVFNIKTLDCQTLIGHTDSVLALAIFPNDPFLLASSSKDNTIRIWRFTKDLRAHQCLYEGTGHTHSIMAISTSKSASSIFLLSGGQDTTLKYWKIPSERDDTTKLHSLQSQFTKSFHESTINSIDVSPNDAFAVTGSQDKTAKLCSLPSLEILGVFRGHKKGIWSVKFSPVDQLLVTGSADATVKIWSISNFNCLSTLQGHMSSVLRCVFIDDGLQLITSSSDGDIRIWDSKSNECTATFEGHQAKIWALTMSYDGETFFTGGDDSMIKIWQNKTLEYKEQERIKEEEMIENEQTIQNLFNQKRWTKALCLKILNEMLLESSGDIDCLIKELSQLRKDQLLNLLEYATHWNSNSKHWIIAHCIIKTIFKQFNPDELLDCNEFKTKIEKILPYSERHRNRIDKLRQSITFADFIYEQMKLPDKNQNIQF
ncbi:WD domain containing protein 20 [Sarcoptes scabiei]|uniref:WD domain containing protein 20 n=1 Tax=Sarcoptes scabiei TaxID=52283 RepID=A0A132A371_SARSC|nr:WD domain containing protein 20 [Sarcoptes scabiei]